MELPTITYEQLLSFNLCWAKSKNGKRRLQYYNRKLGGKANALDILRLRRVSADDRIWVVLREELIPAKTLHEFACWCAEEALKSVDGPDQRSVAAVEVKRQWLRGEITGEELVLARDDARDAAWDAPDAAWGAARAAMWAAARDARAAAWGAARAAAWDALDAAAQIQQLIKMLED